MPKSEFGQLQNRSWRTCIEAHLREFENGLSPDPPPDISAKHWKPFSILVATGDSHPEWGWSPEMSKASSMGFPNTLGGVYLYVDSCYKDNVRSNGTSKDFTVIRWIGSAKTFLGEFRSKQQAPKPPRFFVEGAYRWRVIIPFHDDMLYLGKALEHYLLSRVNTTDNKNDRYCFKGGWIFDQQAG